MIQVNRCPSTEVHAAHAGCRSRASRGTSSRTRATGLLVALATAAGALTLAPAAGAITYGEKDGATHQNVGALIAEGRQGVVERLCSGTLISPRVFLTAAHCTAHLEARGIAADEVWVSFDVDVDPVTASTTLHRGRWVTNPRFSQRQSDAADLAVIVFEQDLAPTPAALPRAGLLDDMKAAHTLNAQRFTAVGYGAQQPEIGGGPPRFASDGERWRAVSSFNALSATWLRLLQTASTGDGGTCFGDSGGPNFLGTGTETVPGTLMAIVSTGDMMCLATSTNYRLDSAPARDFLQHYVNLP